MTEHTNSNDSNDSDDEHSPTGSRLVESEEPEATRQALKDGSVYVTAATMPHDSPTGSIEDRLEDAIKQLSIIAHDSDDEWFTALMAKRVVDLERDWALKNDFEYHGGAE
jgi:hypothetical protein